MEYKYTSIVLGKRDVGETDRIYSLYTLEGGKVQALAKGVRKTGAKLAGLLENFTYADISVARNQGMGKITSSVVENGFPSLRRDYYSLSKTLSIFNIFNKIVDLDHKDPAVFMLLREFLEAVDSQSLISSTMKAEDYEDRIELLSSVFLYKLLDTLGYGSQIDGCAECGKEIGKSVEADVFFSARSGGLVCSECGSKTGNILSLSGNSVKLMHISLKNNLKSFARLKAQRKDVNHIKMAIREILAWI
ncbi:MAG: repair protein RecO protein [Candidatus Moranbacteria bacterium GW2011_GWE1_49_15]|nr:MAG: repair protein RecO protein [Candidatus Moranbacteria bacterium GW2011_GWE1_49_15]